MICPNCKRKFEPPFVPARRSKPILCRICYFEKKGDLDMAFAEIAWQQGYEFGWRQGKQSTSTDTSLISEKLVQEALILTHPDRHPPERFMHANTVTASLLGLRDMLRKMRKSPPSRVQ